MNETALILGGIVLIVAMIIYLVFHTTPPEDEE